MSRLPFASPRRLRLVPFLLAVALAGCGGVPRGPLVSDDVSRAEPGSPAGRSASLARMADTALKTGEGRTAAGLYEEALMLDRDNLAAALGLGNALLVTGRPQEAGRAFEQALNIDADSVAAHYGYARAMLTLRRPEVAVDHLETALKLQPHDLGSLNALGVAHDLMGRHDLAVAAYQRGLAVSPGSVALRNNLGLSLALGGRYAEALAQLRPLGEGSEAGRRTRQNLALVYGLQGDLGAAHRIGRIDLSEDELRDNLAYMASVRALRDSKLKAGAIAPLATARQVEPVRLAAAEPAGLVELAPAMARSAPAHSPAATARRQPRPLAPATSAPRRLGAIEPEAAPSFESWFVDLGRYADGAAALAQWRMLQEQHRQTFGGLRKLAGAESGPEPLLVGPLPSEKAAEAICAKMPDGLPTCAVVQL